MQNKTTPDDKGIAQFQEDINMPCMEASRQIPTLKAKGILPPEDYSRQCKDSLGGSLIGCLYKIQVVGEFERTG